MKNGPLKDYMDLSNFPTSHECFDDKRKGKLCLLKSETGHIPINEMIALAPKCYSVQLDNNTVKSTAKGVNTSERMKLNHKYYSDVHDATIKDVYCHSSTIRTIDNKMYTLCSRKKTLAKQDQKDIG